jgi:hypothetical protein
MSLRSAWKPARVRDGTRRGLRPAVAALLTTVVFCISALSAGGVALAGSGGSCDSWNGGSGLWGDASNWSTGVPGSNTDVCITASGTYTVTVEDLQNANSVTLGGGSGTQTLVVVGNKTVESELTITAASTVNPNGVLEVSSTDAGSSYLRDTTISNDGTFKTIGSGSITPDQVYTGITNTAKGTVDIDDDSEFPLNSSVIANSGTFNIASGAVMDLDGPNTFTQSGGRLRVFGTLQTFAADVFVERGGTESGKPVNIDNTAFKDSKGTGTFDLEGIGTTVSGTVPRGQTLNLLGSPADDETTLASPHVLNDGTIVLTSKAGNFAELEGAGLVNTGRVDVEGTGQDELRSNITNEAGGVVDLATHSPALLESALTNKAKLLLGGGARATLDGGSIAFRPGSITDVTIAAKGGGPEISGPGTVSLGGTLEVSSVGSLKVGRSYRIISDASPKGRFTRLEASKPSFRITYSSTSVTLTVARPRHG